MTDISHTIVAKSDQLNACDLLGGPITVKVESVKVKDGKKSDQPVSIFIPGGYQPFKPCLSMRRVLAYCWGKDSSKWVGRYMTLYCEESVVWAGEQCGGIRISHLSDIKEKQSIILRASKHKVMTWVVHPMGILEIPASAEKKEKPYDPEAAKNICFDMAMEKGITATQLNDFIAKKYDGAEFDSLQQEQQRSVYLAIEKGTVAAWIKEQSQTKGGTLL